MVKLEHLAMIGVAGLGVYALFQTEKVKTAMAGAGGFGGLGEMLPQLPQIITIPQIRESVTAIRESIQLPSLADIIPDIPEIPSLADIIPDIPSLSDILPDMPKLPSISEKISSGIAGFITSIPRGVSEGITSAVRENPIATSVLTGAGIGATIGSVVPFAGTLAGAGVGGITGLLASVIPQRLIPDLQNWFSGLGGYRGLGSQAIGTTKDVVVERITTGFEPTSVIQSIVAPVTGGGMITGMVGAAIKPARISTGVSRAVSYLPSAAQRTYERLTPEPFRRFIYGW